VSSLLALKALVSWVSTGESVDPFARRRDQSVFLMLSITWYSNSLCSFCLLFIIVTIHPHVSHSSTKRTKLSRCCRGGGGVLVSGTSEYYFHYTEDVPEPENTSTSEATETSAEPAASAAAAAPPPIPLPVAAATTAPIVDPVLGTDEEIAIAAAVAVEAMLGL